MSANIIHLNEQIATLNPKHLQEVELFVEFLLTKQQKKSKNTTKKKKNNLLSDIQPIGMPVSQYIIQRDDIYEDRF